MSIFLKKLNKTNTTAKSNLDHAKKLKIMLILSILSISIWVFILYNKIIIKIEYNKHLIKQTQDKINLLEELKSKNNKIENKIKNIESELNCFNKKNPKKEINYFAKQAGINLKAYNLISSDQTKIENAYHKNTFSYEFSGNIDQIMAFCQKITESKLCFDLQEINLSKKTSSEFSIIIKAYELLNK